LDAVRVDARELEVAKRQVRLERCAVRRPAGGVGTGGRDFPPRLARTGAGRVDRPVPRTVPRSGDAMALVGFPIEVARQLNEAVESRFAFTQQARGIGLPCGEMHDLFQDAAADAPREYEAIR